MTSNDSPVSALKLSDRIEALDIMRGVVLLGILLMKINGMGLAGTYENPTVSGGATGWDLKTWITINMLFEGTMRALFSLLFGVGMFILLDRLEKKGARNTTQRHKGSKQLLHVSLYSLSGKFLAYEYKVL